ncbi:MAG: hypothetical protein ACLFVP_01155 [Candidatus Bathyarchaeia archaeon]
MPLEVGAAVMCFERGFYSTLLEKFYLDDAEKAPSIAGGLEGRVSDEVLVYRCCFGAPAAGLHLESLIASGVDRVIVAGEAGSISPDLELGDIYLPLWGVREEGTSYHYLPPDAVCEPSNLLLNSVRDYLDDKNPKMGGVWTIDAGLRETEDKIKEYSVEGVHAVEMGAPR